MRSLRIVKQFKKDLKRAKKNPRQDTEKLFEVVEILLNNGCLPDEYRPHQLVGDWQPMQECHIQPDFLLIYHVTDEEVCLHGCGSHAHLFKK